jgi:hypothetical protein
MHFKEKKIVFFREMKDWIKFEAHPNNYFIVNKET